MVRAGCGMAALLVLAGCAGQAPDETAPAPDVVEVPTDAAPVAPAPAAGAVTAEQFDTTTQEERIAAAAPVSAPERRLGVAIASLGDPAEPGFWAETSLVSTVTQGRLDYPTAGTSVKVELRPSSSDAGTRVSLPAMRVLEAPLTGLPELVVYASGSAT